jgi:hypothetical protein
MINKIFWRIGQEITPDTFIQADKYICSQHNLIRRLIAGKYFGLIPPGADGAPSHTVKVRLDYRDVIAEQILCCGTTESGCIVQFEKNMLASLPQRQVSIPNTKANAYYLVLHVNPYEQVLIVPVDNDEAPEAHSAYELVVKELEQIEADELAILKLDCTGRSPVVDPEYIPPCISIDACAKSLEVFDTVKTLFTEIRTIIHAKRDQFGKLMYPLTLLHHELNEFAPDESPIALVSLIKKFLLTYQYFIPDIRKIFKVDSLEQYCHNDVSLVFNSLLSCLQEIKLMISKVEEEIEEDFTPKI